MSVVDLKAQLKRENVDISECVEKSDLVNLYVRTVGKSKFEPEVRNRPKTDRPPVRSPPTAPRRPQYGEYTQSRSSSLPAFSWQNAFIALFFAMYVYKNYFGEGADMEFGEVEYDGKGSTAFLEGQVMEVGTHAHFKQILQQHKDDTGLPVVVDFFSHSCGPCRMIAPAYKRLAHDMKGEAVFLKIDVNRNYETSRACFISSMPTFQFYLNGKKKAEFSGANGRELERLSRQFASEAKSKGVYLNQEVTAASLANFYKDVEPAKAETSPEIAQKYSKKTAMLMRMLKKKYEKQPAVSDRRGGGAGASPGVSPHEEDENNVEVRMSGDTVSVDGALFDITAIPDRMLMDEVARRREQREGDDEALFTSVSSFKTVKHKVVIVGGGPAGLSAAVYAARAGLNPVIIAPSFGGQLLGKGVDVENYPGVVGHDATGRGLVQVMRRQAHHFGTRLMDESVISIEKKGESFEIILNDTDSTVIGSDSVIVATGASSRWLDVKGEYELRGNGVSSCATCDGFLFRDHHVVVIGGGDTAMEDALVLARTSSKVTVIHRRGTFRASHVLADRVLKHGTINVLWNTTVEEFEGKVSDHGKKVLTHVLVKNTGTGVSYHIQCAGAFVAIGHDPNTKILKDQGVEMDANGYIKTFDGSTKTSVPGLFAAGDVADRVYRQAITSAGSGAMGALDAERYLSERGVQDERKSVITPPQ